MNQTFAWGLVIGALGCTGCAANESMGAGAHSAEVSNAGLDGPGTGDASSDRGSSHCRATGPSSVVASRIYVPAGVEARSEEGQVSIRFAHRKARCTSASVLTLSGAVVGSEAPAECPGASETVVATSEGETMRAREASVGDRTHVELGVVVYDAPRNVFGFRAGPGDRLVERVFAAPQGASAPGESNPGLVPIGRGRFLLTWVDDSPDGRGLHAQPVARWGEAVGPALDLSPPDVSVIGRASTVVEPDGRGLVAYLASNGHGFDLRVTPIACNAR